MASGGHQQPELIGPLGWGEPETSLQWLQTAAEEENGLLPEQQTAAADEGGQLPE